MRTLLFAAAALMFSASASWAACTCVCENGKAIARCPSVLEKAPNCPTEFCSAGTATPAPAMPKSADCKLEKVINPATGRLEMRKVCK